MGLCHTKRLLVFKMAFWRNFISLRIIVRNRTFKPVVKRNDTDYGVVQEQYFAMHRGALCDCCIEHIYKIKSRNSGMNQTFLFNKFHETSYKPMLIRLDHHIQGFVSLFANAFHSADRVDKGFYALVPLVSFYLLQLIK